ncbi:SRPBCC family protein [Variovorax sp. J22P240]|uniref:CoxG family protein n=1 Tax=Variovorax sp. J22P240 TaxID=3053514 RepID=UPI002577E135|nr:SRPBCC family protein [Variovorax sp. J22P240]MDL9999149.1 SRPBCC family protein [Variovorax sp. J22P240]
MEVKVDKRYPLEVDAARAWQLLRDVKTVAGFMPGAAITEQIDDTHYKGNVKVKVGPANAAFAGDIEVLALDEAAMKLQLLGKGADRGGSSASMDLTATIEPGDSPSTSVLAGQAVVAVSGKFAQFGSRLMVPVSDMLLGQFVDNFRAAAAAPSVTYASADDVASQVAVPTSVPPVAQAREINALAMMWSLVKGWFAGLLGKRT